MALSIGKTITNPMTGSQWTLVAGGRETGERGFRLDVRCKVRQKPDILEHFHLGWTETFEILDGTARYKLGGKEMTALAGETLTFAPGVAHIHPWAGGDTDMIYRQSSDFGAASPNAADDVLGSFYTLFGMAREGKLDARGLPRNPLQAAATLRTLVRHKGYDASAPIWAQNVLAATLGSLAVALGYRAVYARYLDA